MDNPNINEVKSDKPEFLHVGEILIPPEIFDYLITQHGIDKDRAIELFRFIIRTNHYRTPSPFHIFNEYLDSDIDLLEYRRRNLERKRLKDKAEKIADLDKEIQIRHFSSVLVIFILYLIRFTLVINAADKFTLQITMENKVPSFGDWLVSDDFKTLAKRIEEGDPQRAYEIHEKFIGLQAIADMQHHKKS